MSISTCALTQLGLIRLSCNPAFTTAAVTPHEAALCHRLTSHLGDAVRVLEPE